jgi:exopolysaccharide biosynthesis polyprenyl glycosylphosphotransferase
MNDTRRAIRASNWVLGALVVAALYIAITTLLEHRDGPFALMHVAAAMVGVGASTGKARKWAATRSSSRPARRRRVMMVGAGPVAEHLAREAEEKGYHVLGFVEDLDPEKRMEWPQHVLAPRAAVSELALYLRADEIIVVDSPARVELLLDQIERDGVPADVFIVPDTYELGLCPPTSCRLGDVPLYRLPRRESGWVSSHAKRATDVAISLLILALSSPFLLLAMLAIKLSSRGPALFRQVRVGRNGRHFEIVKLRTMVADAERDGPKFCAGKGDPRLTPVGRFLRLTHLDEVPQLWNVLRGEMSLVGPRPERPVFVEQFERELPRYADRHRILPGITGLAQINGYYHSTAREKLRFDLMYLYHGNFWLDISIIVRTALGVFH